MSRAKSICTVCNYIYDESKDTALVFADLPDNWRCPECRAAKEMFQPCSCVSLHTESNCPENGIESPARNSIPAAYVNSTVGQLVVEKPLRACVFEQLGIDYCCGGKLSLAEACKIKGLDFESVKEKLAAVDKLDGASPERDWSKETLKSLTEHIIEKYHQPLRLELSRIANLTEKVAKAHGQNHPEMIELKKIFGIFKTELEFHMQKEEMILFPGIVAMESSESPRAFGCGGGIEHPIQVMTLEHDDAGAFLCKLRKLSNDYIAPADACNSFKVLLYSLAQLESEMHQHVHKENNILFPRAIALQEQVFKKAPPSKVLQ
ncbi:MAG: iron-sulfur cluster repair di-iron protein [Candidatus Obscuribacterales bacterium]|nr:iron-sulfur cluster repair di-iron protein [Candidatus Obscuribacterales bacterium]